MITHLLISTGDYELLVADASAAALERIDEREGLSTQTIDAENSEQLAAAMKNVDSVISALSFYYNPRVAKIALEIGVNYFDLTEDVATTRAVATSAEKAAPGQVFMPQCGLAPGFISIVAHHLCHPFDELDSVRMRVGALSKFPTGQLKYNLTWSTDGLINEYCNPCEAIHDGKQIEV
ncbi:MAG TPA: saccharopine dehydrogenase NADP-binding domain-containing protein, partial [Pirellulales bacterium]|nr:saccharopine dehydrogenase NADP-binding domain-containing protein [Pirellulales bacterium]